MKIGDDIIYMKREKTYQTFTPVQKGVIHSVGENACIISVFCTIFWIFKYKKEILVNRSCPFPKVEVISEFS